MISKILKKILIYCEFDIPFIYFRNTMLYIYNIILLLQYGWIILLEIKYCFDYYEIFNRIEFFFELFMLY